MKQRIPSWRLATAALTGVMAAIAIAACGGSAAPKSSTTTSANTALKFAECMRSHSVPDFPDSGSGVADSLIVSNTYAKAGGKLLSESPQVVNTAANKCQKYSPDSLFGPVYTASQLAEVRAGGLVYAKCMRAHGIDYPDPLVTAGPGGHGYAWGLPPKSRVPFRSPAFKSAATTCRWPHSGEGLK
ncbi:MAG: hypothetical protein ACRDL5_07205 [Solirubrobacteraceae bacterium]